MNLRKKRKSDPEIEEFDITSLLDILVILLVFLLKSFNDSDLTVDLVTELALPYSMSRTAANNGVIVQVNSEKNVYLNTNLLGNLDDLKTLNSLEVELKKKSTGPSPSNQIINFLFDKGLLYIDINSVIKSASSSGYDKYKLIIQGDE